METTLIPHQDDFLGIGDSTVTFDKDKKHDFDLEYVLHSFKKCAQDEKTLLLDEYLNAFHELCRFFKLTGRLFSFVARDIESKIKAVEYRMCKYGGIVCLSIQSMISFEILKEKTHRKSPHPSGSRTLLRLHYALEFILAFMERIANSDDQAKTSQIAWEVYSETLSKHHPWITQKVAFLVVYALPSKRELIEVMCKHDYSKVKMLLSDVIEAGYKVYRITEDVYQSHDLSHIP